MHGMIARFTDAWWIVWYIIVYRLQAALSITNIIKGSLY